MIAIINYDIGNVGSIISIIKKQLAYNYSFEFQEHYWTYLIS